MVGAAAIAHIDRREDRVKGEAVGLGAQPILTIVDGELAVTAVWLKADHMRHALLLGEAQNVLLAA